MKSQAVVWRLVIKTVTAIFHICIIGHSVNIILKYINGICASPTLFSTFISQADSAAQTAPGAVSLDRYNPLVKVHGPMLRIFLVLV